MEGLSGNSGMKPQVTKVSTYFFDMNISYKKPLREKKFLLSKDTILSFNGITPIFKI